MIDILFNFRTTYVEEGEALVTNPFKIAIHYFKSYFVMDLVAAVPWELLINADDEGVNKMSANVTFLVRISWWRGG